MDILSHALWGVTIVRNKELLPLVFGASVLPDVGTLPQVFEVLRFYYKDYKKGTRRSFKELLTDWKKIQPSEFALNFYHSFHSLIFWLGITILLFLLAKDFLVTSFVYFLHLIIDLPTHREARPLFPFSNFRFRGTYFLDNKWVFVANILLLIIVNVFIFILA